ncbi:hypothetical protein B5G50_09885 [Brevibacillus brevis]|nr:hypothetical protein B5G50_09885 [Brevibacillus brevis]
MNTVLFLLFLGKVAAVEGKKCISSLRFGLRPTEGWTVRSEINDGSASKVVISMKDSQRLKLKTPVIYFETGSGSRGAWRRLDWKCTSSQAALFYYLRKIPPVENSKDDLPKFLKNR